MSNFSAPPTDGLDHCGRSCPPGNSCFVYNGGMTCQPFQAPSVYPATGANVTNINPPQWYLTDSYPTLRYTGSLAGQTLNASCTTIPIPVSNVSNGAYIKLMRNIILWDLGGYYSPLDDLYPSTLAQYRGNCAEEFYCHPSEPVNTTLITKSQMILVRGELPGTCQPLRAESQPCLSTNMCTGWHVGSDGFYNITQLRCVPPRHSLENGTLPPSGICQHVAERQRDSFFERAANMYLFSTMVLLVLLFMYIWYRRQKNRQRLQAMHDVYSQGVYRPSDGTDNGGLPAYGAHRVDRQVVAPGSEEYGMYAYPRQPPVAVYYPPLSREPSGALSSHQAVGAAIISQETAAIRHREGGISPPAYNPSDTTIQRPPSPTTAAAMAVAAGAGSVPETTGAIEGAQLTGEKQKLGHPTSDTKEKSSLTRDQEFDPDQASTSSSGSGSGSRTNSSAIPKP